MKTQIYYVILFCINIIKKIINVFNFCPPKQVTHVEITQLTQLNTKKLQLRTSYCWRIEAYSFALEY